MIATAKTLNKTAQKILFALAGSYAGARLSVVTLARTYAHGSIVVARYTKHTRHKNNIIICGIGSVFRIAITASLKELPLNHHFNFDDFATTPFN